MKTGRFDTIPLSYVRDSTKLILGIRDTLMYDQIIDFHITQCLSNVLRTGGALSVQNCVVDICDNSAKLPDGIMRLIGVRQPCDTETSSNVNQSPNYWLYLDRAFLQECEVGNVGGNFVNNSIVIRDGYIYFNNTDDELTAVEISWLGQIVDENGDFVIYTRYQMCLQFYAAYMVSVSHPKKFPAGQEFKGRFIAARDAVRGRDAKDKFDDERTQIRHLLRTWYGVPNPAYKTY